jgi:FKBP-type peptidyl-prolyl cis-trans isomerase FkpA
MNKEGVGDGDPTNNDTDSDGIPDYLDQDDDGDNYPTKYEIKKPNGSTVDDGPSLYYPFDPIISNPPKPTDEKRGIPSCTSVYTGTRTRKYLDPSCH